MRTHKDASVVHGPNFETRVREMLIADDRFALVREATRTEQREGHFDIFAKTVTGITLRIECKSIKDNNDSLAVIEGRTVCDKTGQTHPGWLFGQANQIAFERADGRITWVTMGALQRYVIDKQIDWDAMPLTKKGIGTLYTRTSGREQDTMVTEHVLCGKIEIDIETRGDRIVYFPMFEQLNGAYTL